MGERRTQPTQQPRHADRHAQLLRPSAQDDRLDAVRDEGRVPGDRGNPEALGNAGQRPQQLTHICLVARAATAEDVRVDDDHASASRYTSTVAFATPSHRKARARSSPRATSAPRCAAARSRPAARSAGSLGSTSTAAPSAISSIAVPREVTTAARAAVELREVGVAHLAEPADAVPADLDAAPAARADHTQLDAVAPSRLHDARKVLTRLERPDGKHVVALRRRAVRRELLVDAVRDDADLRVGDVQHLDQLAAGEVGDGNDPARGREHARNEPRAVRARPAVERIRVAKDGEVVHGHDERERRAERPAVRRAVQDVAAPVPAEGERVPERVASKGREPFFTAERRRRDVDVVAPTQLAQQRREVARGAGASLDQRRIVDQDLHDSASA